MFSKLHARGAHAEALLPPAASPFGDPSVFERVSGGTFGLCFSTTLDGTRRFLKTHGSSPEARASLAKEIGLLTYLNGAALHAECISMADGGLWLVMDELSPADAPTPAQILELTATYSEKLAAYPDPGMVPSEDRFSRLLAEGEQAFAALNAQQMLGPELRRAMPSYLALLRRMEPKMPSCLCHGDLGPRNLMTNGIRLFAIDWEDAFWGVEGYDYLYWMTFFENRRYYGPAMFGHTPWGKEVEIAILLMVLAIKCGLSLRDGTHEGNHLTFDRRLLEILALA